MKLFMLSMVGFALMTPCSARAVDAKVEELRKTFEHSKQAIQAEYDKGIATLGGKYAEQLQKIAAHHKKQAAIDAYVAVQEEIARVKKYGGVDRLSASVIVDAYVKKAQQSYFAQEDKLGALRDKRLLLVMTKMFDLMDDLEKDFKRLSNAAGEEDLDAFRQDVLGDADLSMARKRSGERKLNIASNPVPNKEEKQKISTGVKMIDIRGYRLSSEWTPVLIDILPGDKVTIKAEGSWRPPNTKSETGPEGLDRYIYSGYKQYKKHPYGALLYRFDGEAKRVRSGVEFTADREGQISLDANVKSEKSFRRTGKGSMKVSIRVEHAPVE